MLHPITGRRHRGTPADVVRRENAVGADLAQRHRLRRLIAAVGDPLLKGAKGCHVHERILAIIAVDRGQMDEAHPVLEGKGGVAETSRRRLCELIVDLATSSSLRPAYSGLTL